MAMGWAANIRRVKPESGATRVLATKNALVRQLPLGESREGLSIWRFVPGEVDLSLVFRMTRAGAVETAFAP